MTLSNLRIGKPLFIMVTLFTICLLASCGNDDDGNVPLQSRSFVYQIHNGQAVSAAPYAGFHQSTLSATLKLDELENGNTNITVSIQNTINGETYHTHAHDAADAGTTPNGTPYLESPNTEIFAQPIIGNGSTASSNQEANRSFDDLVSSYDGFFVIHDPLQAINTADIGTFLVVGGFAKEQQSVNFSSSTFDYTFNNGQLASAFAYDGNHENTLSARIIVDELAENNTRVTVKLMNTLNGEVYHTHAHDAADPNTTPNGTPYVESPNGAVFAAPLTGTGGTASKTVISTMSYDELISVYDGFFVIHDPLQAISTVDPTTFVILNMFAR